MKIAIITDAHANLPALEAVLDVIDKEKCDAIFHVGDELYYVNGLPKPQPSWMSDGEVKHQLWTHRRLGEHRKSIIAQWPLFLEDEFGGVKTIFMHYGLTSSQDDFRGFVRNPSDTELDQVFAGWKAEIVFFGHDHSPSDIEGKTRYINPGSLGCNQDALARYVIADSGTNQVIIKKRSVKYDDKALYDAFENRNVPERAFIYRVFFGGRFRA